MNTVLILVMLILVIFALKEGMIWVALGVGFIMVLIAAGEGDDTDKEKKKFTYPAADTGGVSPAKEQMLRVKYQPTWDGNNWWEEMSDHWGVGMGRMFGILR